MPIPELEPHCGSWIVTARRDGKVVGEFYSRSLVERINTERYSVETAAQYLGRLNRSLLAAGNGRPAVGIPMRGRYDIY